MTKIMRCNCSHKFQDKRYGKQMRVHNEGQSNTIRCTVCAKETRKLR